MVGARTTISRSNARALVVAGASSRGPLVSMLQGLNFVCAEVDDPYVALAELCRRPLAYRALVLSLAGLYREELALVKTVKTRFPHVEVWLTHSDGRHAALADAMRLGADGLLGDDGFHRTATPVERQADPAVTPPNESRANHVLNVQPVPANGMNGYGAQHAQASADEKPGFDKRADDRDDADSDFVFGEPVLTADELRALLQEQPTVPGED